MDFSTHYIRVDKTARYLSYGNLTAKTVYFWFVLHGSKMLADQMIYKFENFDPDIHFVIAPEGLNRFYESGFGGNVVASWMTKRDRLHEIADFSNYLSTLYISYLDQIPATAKKIVLGFSQGGTTSFRWLHRNKIELDHLLAYSCWIPEDIDLTKSQTSFKQIEPIYTYGAQDQYLKQDRITALKQIIEKNGLSLQIEPYEGDHRVSKNQLTKLFNSYIKS